MKKLLLTIFVLCVTGSLFAQTPCESAFNKAKDLYTKHKYGQAKEQFSKVVNNCDSKKEIAIEYIELCNAKLENENNKKATTNAKSNNITENVNYKEELKRINIELQEYKKKYAEVNKQADSLFKLNRLKDEQLKSMNADKAENVDNLSQELQKLRGIINDVDERLKEYVDSSGFKNWIKSKDLKRQANDIIKKIKETKQSKQ